MDDGECTDGKGLSCCRLFSGYQKSTMAIRQRRAANSEVINQSLSRPLSVALALLVVSVFINYVDRGNLSVAAPLIKNELGISASQLGILLSAFFWTYTLMLFVCGCFVDRFDPSRVLALGYLVWSLATAATGIVRGFAMLLLMRLILGTGESVAFPCYSKILARHVPEHYRGFANGVICAGMKLGPAGGTLGAGLLMANYGWRPVFLGIALVSLVWLPAWMKLMPRAERQAHSAGASPRMLDILQQRPFWATAAGAFCCAYPLYFTITWLPFYLVHDQHLSLQNMVYIAALYYTVDAAAALATGCVTDFWIRRDVSAGVMRKTAMALGWTTAAIGLLGCSSAGPHSYLAWLMIAGVGLGTGNANFWAFTQTLAGPRAVGRWAGLQNGFGNLAGVIGPALTGFTVDWTGHFQLAIGITAGVCLLGVLVWLFLVGEFRQVSWVQPARPVEFV
jgi:MFS transporter, ACS family, D-galactonate transporter